MNGGIDRRFDDRVRVSSIPIRQEVFISMKSLKIEIEEEKKINNYGSGSINS